MLQRPPLRGSFFCAINKFMEEQDRDLYEFAFDINGLHVFKGVVDYAIAMWPGSPLRPPEEQEFLWHMRDEVNRCILEHNFNHLD